MTIRKNNKPKVQKQQNVCEYDLLEQYSPLKIGKIIPTKTEKKSNIFNTFRPKLGECLDYNISETFVKWNVGDTKINVKQTKASYVPAPPEAIKPQKTKKVVRSHSGPPQWKFIDEIWREKQDQLQIQSKREFKQFSNRRKCTHKNQASSIHNWILGMVGPEWFQELSPKQLKTADQLKYCMAQDYKDNTIIQTKENIGSLGLVPRPKSKHILLALNLCCGIDVEFLLSLYQLIDPNRSEYSINDRLLLSAVVHLTMTETLRELHIRIPSPPRKKIGSSKGFEKPEKKRYKSPYLVPFTFKPEPPKYSGVYENKHFQYPQNPYFSYIDELYQEKQFTENILSVNVAEKDSGIPCFLLIVGLFINLF
nr:uncharacterized protein LOC111516478 isoform X1 [Leptinotarsa decemlineata]XP_023028401.1 uncharacterized protein LOC111516478 isoform X2 [Leptinotarsa decemlineata]XP_023028402.1 uncharacterized protein LOC111516478 isoform X3 [Leptinotarsa decemlineata]